MFWNSLGHSYFNIKQLDKAIEAYKKVIEIKPDKEVTWFQVLCKNGKRSNL